MERRGVGGRFVEQASSWQQYLSENHRTFAVRLGRCETEWAAVRARRRAVSVSFAVAIIRAAPEPWRAALVRAYVADVEDRLTAAASPAD